MANKLSAEKTEITGRTASKCTGKNADNKTVRYTVGQKVWIQVWVPAFEGGDLSSKVFGTITRIGEGTEMCMLGTTAICEILGEDGKTYTKAARMLQIWRLY